ncbi:MAG: hypothetical protein D6798_06890 [Deltaproteobacteria bacterium]|nr:MAG: hypothetical protein D6798_06890 [Deltaproteobacteria bacterium]
MIRLLPLLSLPLFLACGDASDDTAGSGSDGGATDGGAASDGGSAGDGGTTGGTARLAGRVIKPDGSPANVQMRLCAELCRSIMTEADGSFEYTSVEAAHYALEAVNLADQKTVSTPLDFLTIEDGADIELAEPIISYDYVTVEDLTDGANVLTVDGGLRLWVDQSAMTPSESNSPYLADGEADYVAAVAVSPDAIGLPLEEIEGEIVAAWFMGRMNVKLSPPWTFTTDDTHGLAEGESVRILGADYDSKGWLDGGTATVTDGALTSDEGSGIPVLSTVLFVRE